ncbi:MAG: redox-regulated ATPase YchF [Archaeoglobaceae archaeon]|nr:redox-regulated ATPase YchF [Archaeoglobaceae archaeon]MCX8151618.1 redox-regulated ATPase YchF [Archaeoglobaceae archaeon]MDW8013104.1 redox-regulated ATPase YchF [Archaeoglobaceae archaeon]
MGIAGKPNAGKSTFFKASTLIDVEIADYPFTTIEPNIGVGHVKVKCVCKEFDVECRECVDGWRFVPVKLIDVAGLVPDAHKGRGLGNEFLDNLRQAEGIIHVVDASGSTDADGNIVGIGERDPLEDVKFLNHELDMWFYGILKRNWEKILRKGRAEKRDIVKLIVENLSGLGFEEWMIRDASKNFDLYNLNDEDLLEFARELRKRRMKMVIAANKCDIAPKDFVKKLIKLDAIPCSSVYELVLRTAAKNNYIKYFPGDGDFEILKELNEKQRTVLRKIKEYLKEWGDTGIQKTINKLVFDVLEYAVVYPVEDENKLTDSKGNVLPDAFLVKKGTNARELAYKIHTEIGKNFICAIDVRTGKRIGEDYILKNNDVIKIVSSA